MIEWMTCDDFKRQAAKSKAKTFSLVISFHHIFRLLRPFPVPPPRPPRHAIPTGRERHVPTHKTEREEAREGRREKRGAQAKGVEGERLKSLFLLFLPLPDPQSRPATVPVAPNATQRPCQQQRANGKTERALLWSSFQSVASISTLTPNFNSAKGHDRQTSSLYSPGAPRRRRLTGAAQAPRIPLEFKRRGARKQQTFQSFRLLLSPSLSLAHISR